MAQKLTQNSLAYQLEESFTPWMDRYKKYLRHAVKKQTVSSIREKISQKCGPRHTIYFPTGLEYKGEWKDNKKHGWGTYVCRKSGGMYEGEWKWGRRDGHGTFSILNPQTNQYSKKYCGSWKKGMKNGFGTFFYYCSSVYEGEWRDDKRWGWGKMSYSNGDVYEGEWWEGKCDGKGVFRCENGNWFEGLWTAGKKNGYGKLFYSAKGQLYEGYWLDGNVMCGTIIDYGRNDAPQPPKYQIPQAQLVDMHKVWTEGIKMEDSDLQEEMDDQMEERNMRVRFED